MTIHTASALMAGSLLLGGCWMPSPAYMFADKPKPAAAMLRLESEPAGAEAQASFGMSCHTPCILPLGGAGKFVVTFVRTGYLPVTVPISVQVPQTRRPDPEITLDRPAPRIVANPVVVRLPRDPNFVSVKRVVARPAKDVAPETEAPVVAPDPND
jgi:hypothetical protein